MVSDEYVAVTDKLHQVIQQCAFPMRTKQMAGPTWGAGDYSAASLDLSAGRGLHKITFAVLHTRTGYPVATGETLVAAMNLARMVLRSEVWPKMLARIVSLSEQMDKYERAIVESAKKDADVAIRVASLKPAKKVSRRRKQIFAEADGKCHYCKTPIQIDGYWHVDHKMPRALGGDDDASNLVASCVACNLKKSDRTDTEFEALMRTASRIETLQMRQS